MADPTCSNCGTTHHPDDVFCENCGYDFLTGSLPDAPEVSSASGAPAAMAAAGAAAGAAMGAAPDGPSADETLAPPVSASDNAGVETTTVEIAVDVDYFAAAVEAGQLDLPNPLPVPTTVELRSSEIHIGRTSDSRNIHPDLDLAALTSDPAVSSRHAIIRRTADGFTLTDVGSTNGTVLDDHDGPLVSHHVAHAIEPGQPIFIGAWTRLTIIG